jgi:hypothetical protein
VLPRFAFGIVAFGVPRQRRPTAIREPGHGDCNQWSGSLDSSRLTQSFGSGLTFGGQSPLPEKDPYDLEAASWRLRFVVWFDQSLRTTFLDCQTLRPSGTVAATLPWRLGVRSFPVDEQARSGVCWRSSRPMILVFSLPTAADTEVAGPKNTIPDE